jgi:hypothetical protein
MRLINKLSAVGGVALAIMIALAVGPELLAAAGITVGADAVAGVVTMELAEASGMISSVTTIGGETMSVVSQVLQSLGRPLVFSVPP